MHILLLTRVDDEQWARLQAIVAENPKATISRNDESACQSGTPVTAIVGAPPPELIELLHQLSVDETQLGKQVCSFVSSYYSFKQNIICPFKGDNSNSNTG